MSKNRNVVRVLKTGAVISSAAFGALPPAKQTEVLAEVQGQSLSFVPNFASLTNPHLISSKILAGEDVTTELEFNQIDLSQDELRGLSLVRPLLDKIRSKVASSLFISTSKEAAEARASTKIAKTTVSFRGVTFTMAGAVSMWKRVVLLTQTGTVPASWQVRVNGSYYPKTARIDKEGNVTINGHKITRAQLEYFATETNQPTFF